MRKMKYTITCVLHVGEFYNRHMKVEYGPEHVIWLKKQIDKFYSYECDFVCLSNVRVPGINTIPLEHDWPGWFSKIELFKNFTKAFYLDLDTVLVGNIDNLVRKDYFEFEALRKLSSPQSKSLGSGVMRWKGDYSFIYEIFKKNPDKYIQEYSTPEKHGDQAFLQDYLPRYSFLQKKFPGQIVSYKVDLRQVKKPAPPIRIVCMHGKPKPHEVEHIHDWIPPLF